MLHDENVYPEPQHFDPEHFLRTGNTLCDPDPARAAFGFGRRLDFRIFPL